MLFFTCFSSRINDLNQFRLYGKEGGVEASGCCLVFNKNGDWLKESDVSAPFRSLSEMSGQNSDDLPKVDEYEKLPLYQVAYVAYKDEYIAEKKCGIWLLPQEKTEIRYPPETRRKMKTGYQFTAWKIKRMRWKSLSSFSRTTPPSATTIKKPWNTFAIC